jgi:hypothetical protein
MLNICRETKQEHFMKGAALVEDVCLSVTLVVLGIIRRLLFPSFPLRSDKHQSDGLPHPVHQKHETFHRDKVQHPSVPFQEGERDTWTT